jgi:hypothetical protein
MQGDANRGGSSSGRRPTSAEWANDEREVAWADADGGAHAAKQRLAQLARAIENDVIPRLVQAHRPGASHGVFNPASNAAANGAANAAAVSALTGSLPSAGEIESFVGQIIHDSEAQIGQTLAQFARRGVSAAWARCGKKTSATSPPSPWPWAACSVCCVN